jgi:hypothetical protein
MFWELRGRLEEERMEGGGVGGGKVSRHLPPAWLSGEKERKR